MTVQSHHPTAPGRIALVLAALLLAAPSWAQTTLLNVSYDPTRELYRDVNRAFAARQLADSGQPVTIRMSHGGSGS